jgi:S-adenosyl methyltransferase
MSAMGKGVMKPGFAASEIDTSRPHPARMYDAYLGGNDNYPVDRAAVREILRLYPETRPIALANRAFLQRAVRFLAAEAGIRQFLDIGTGIPSAGNVHEVAGRAAPDARVVYVDNDPIVHVHANALLTGSGTTSVVLADLRDPAAILAHPALREMIDFTRPVALLLVAILHFINSCDSPR